MAKWSKQVRKLESNYDWKAKPGNKVFVADRGAVRFDFPEDWVMDDEASNIIRFRDRQPPDDNCLLEVTVFYLAEGIDWRALPLPEVLAAVIKGGGEDFESRSEIVQIKRKDLELAWLETRFIDPGEKRLACSRTCLARCSNIQPLLTFSFWPEDGKRLEPVWNELLRSLRLGEYIAPPFRRGGN